MNIYIKFFESYLGDDFTDEALQANFTLIFELFDETMDYGYPQNCAVDVLRLYINLGNVLQNNAAGNTGTALTSQITGAIDWRREGIRYRKNEVHIDVFETVTMLTSATGAVLRAEVQGKVMMKTQLTGMPECKFGLNDKLIMEKEGGAAAAAASQKANGVEIDDCTFHRYVCVVFLFCVVCAHRQDVFVTFLTQIQGQFLWVSFLSLMFLLFSFFVCLCRLCVWCIYMLVGFYLFILYFATVVFDWESLIRSEPSPLFLLTASLS